MGIPSFVSPCRCQGHLGCFQLLALVSNAAVNIGVQISVQPLLSTSFESTVRSAGSYGNSMCNYFEELNRYFLSPTDGEFQGGLATAG